MNNQFNQSNSSNNTPTSSYKEEADRVGIGSWIFTIIILAIPILNVIYFVCLLFGLGLQPKVSLARATLILSMIGFLISFGILCLMAGSVDSVIEIYKQFFLAWIKFFKNIRR